MKKKNFDKNKKNKKNRNSNKLIYKFKKKKNELKN